MRKVTQRAVAAAAVIAFFCLSTYAGAVTIGDVQKGEDVFTYVKRVQGQDQRGAHPDDGGLEALRVQRLRGPTDPSTPWRTWPPI